MRPLKQGAARRRRAAGSGGAGAAGQAVRGRDSVLGRVGVSRRHGARQDLGAVGSDADRAPAGSTSVGLDRLGGECARGVLVLHLPGWTERRAVRRVDAPIDAPSQEAGMPELSGISWAGHTMRSRLHGYANEEEHGSGAGSGPRAALCRRASSCATASMRSSPPAATIDNWCVHSSRRPLSPILVTAEKP